MLTEQRFEQCIFLGRSVIQERAKDQASEKVKDVKERIANDRNTWKELVPNLVSVFYVMSILYSMLLVCKI